MPESELLEPNTSRHNPRPVSVRVSQIVAPKPALKLYERAKGTVETGTVIVFGPNANEVERVLLELRHRSMPRFDPLPHLKLLARFERRRRCPASCFDRGHTPSQEFFRLLLECPDDPRSVKVHAAIFLLGWEENNLFVWCRTRLERLSRRIVEQDEDGTIDYFALPNYAA